jgi:purine-binding chemotaxis protein CheW
LAVSAPITRLRQSPNRTQEPAVMSDTQQLVIFSLAGEEYALPITRVQEIIRYSRPRSVASSSPWIRGVINLRGRIVPVCDPAKIAVIETQAGTAGVVVDSVEEVLTVPCDQIERVGTADSDYVDGVAKLEGRLPILLNPDGLLSGIELAA